MSFRLRRAISALQQAETHGDDTALLEKAVSLIQNEIQRRQVAKTAQRNVGGRRFGRLLTLGEVKDGLTRAGNHCVTWLCRCDCGIEKFVDFKRLRNGNTKSCGCLYRENIVKMRLKHGDAPRLQRRRSEYDAWANMVARTTRPDLPAWPNY